MTRQIHLERDVPVPMRDGTLLMADIYRLENSGPKPVLLTRTPYGKNSAAPGFAIAAAERGYTVVQQDTRGRWASQGTDRPFSSEKDDGYDTVEWAARQPWSDGRVGMFGGSYMGYTQWAAAATQPPSLKVVAPAIAFCNPYAITFCSGVLTLGEAVSWSLMAGAQMAIQRFAGSLEDRLKLLGLWTALVDGMTSGKTFQAASMLDLPLIGKDGITHEYIQALEHPCTDSYWENLRIPYEQIQVPAFLMGGWYDVFLADTLKDFAGLKQASRLPHRLLIGPWTHGSFESKSGEIDFGIQSSWMALLPDEVQLRWFDAWLKGERNGLLEEPPVRIFVMGENRWRNENEWPLARTQFTPFYLHGEGAASSLEGDGRLSPELPGLEQPADHFIYDPADPAPTRGGGLCCYAPALRAGAYDQREVETRPDVLVYTSEPLPEDLEVTGPLSARLWIASSAVDTDFTVKLVDVYPCGLAINLQDGIVRARNRNGAVEAELLEPGAVYEINVDLAGTSNVFKAGHRIRVEVSSSNFPRFERNANTGTAFETGTIPVAARQTVFHDAGRPSHILLPVIR